MPILSSLVRGEWKEWAGLLVGQHLPSPFPLTAGTALPPNNNDYLLLADHARWAVKAPAASP